jgi:hypothetical protein
MSLTPNPDALNLSNRPEPLYLLARLSRGYTDILAKHVASFGLSS